MPHGNVGSAIAAYRNSVVRIRGVNTIQAPTPVANFDPRDFCSFCTAAGGMAMDIEMNSAVRQERAMTTITGWIESFNGSTVDLRDTVLTGHLEAALSSNFRLRDQTPGVDATIIGNIVLHGTSELSIHAGSNAEAAIIDGNVICFNNFGVRSDIQFKDDSDGYINCSGVPTDVSIAITEPSDPVVVNTLGVHTLTISNNSTKPTVEAMNVNVSSNILLASIPVTIGAITVTPADGTSCSSFGNGFNCFLGNIAAGTNVNIDVEFTPTGIGLIQHDTNVFLNNFDPNFGDNFASEQTTVIPSP